MANVCCVKVKDIRPKYDNLKEWCTDDNNVYIGRGGIVFINKERYPKKGSIWANPYKISKTCDRDQCIELYEKYIDKIEKENLRDELLKLKGKNLGCWCPKNEKCHGNILVKLINNYSK